MSTIKYNVSNFNRFMNLPLRDDQVQLTYVWIDGTGQSLRTKSRTVDEIPSSPKDCPVWNFCGSATGFNSGNVATLKLTPQALYNDPFRGGNAKLVLCDVYSQDDKPVPANKRFDCCQIMKSVETIHDPWFGIEQEFTLLDGDTDRPLGWPANGYPSPQGPYYCGLGTGKAIGRDISEAHYRACLYAGIPLVGTNAEVMPAQWEFQVGPCKSVSAGDDLWMARFILVRIAEEFGVKITFDPKPMAGDWNGAGAHTNFSTIGTRSKTNGLETIKVYIDRLSKFHSKSIAIYDPSGGKDNSRRLTGKHDTSNINEFSSGIGDRGASIRIPETVVNDGYGYLEDRRPSSNCDPYIVTSSLVQICLLNDLKI